MDLSGNVTGPLVGTPTGKLLVKDCEGFVTKTKGTAVIATGTSSIVVTHGLGATPASKELIKLSLGTDLGAAGLSRMLWVSAVGATTFTVNSHVNTTGNYTFGWEAEALDA